MVKLEGEVRENNRIFTWRPTRLVLSGFHTKGYISTTGLTII